MGICRDRQFTPFGISGQIDGGRTPPRGRRAGCHSAFSRLIMGFAGL